MTAVSFFEPSTVFGIAGIVLTFVVVPLVTFVSLRFGARQWRDVAEGRGQEIHDLRERCAAHEAALAEKDKRCQMLEGMIHELGGKSVLEALAATTEAILRAVEGHEQRAEVRARLAEERAAKRDEQLIGLIENVGHAIAGNGDSQRRAG